MSHNVKIVVIDDYESVVAVSQAFIDALRDGDPDALMTVFHADAVAFGLGEGVWLAGPAHNLRGLIAQVGAAPNIKARIDVLAITPTTAVVRADIEGDVADGSFHHRLATELSDQNRPPPDVAALRSSRPPTCDRVRPVADNR